MSKTLSNLSAVCRLCNSVAFLFKKLQCGDELCNTCSAAQMGVDDEILCPFHGSKTSQKSLQTVCKFQPSCESCLRCQLEEKTEFWFCKTCCKFICSLCAMKFHRQHECEACDLFEEILAIPEDSFVAASEMHNEIENFCQQLAARLKKRLEPAIRIVTGLHDLQTHLKEGSPPAERLVEKIDVETVNPPTGNKIVLHVPKALQSAIFRSTAGATDSRMAFEQFKSCINFQIPPLDLCEATFFQKMGAEKRPASFNRWSQTQDGCDLLKSGQKPAVNLQNDFNLKVSWDATIQLSSMEISHVGAIPGRGAVVVDRLGVHLFDEKLQYDSWRGWGCLAKSNHTYLNAWVHLPQKNLLVILRKSPDSVKNSEFFGTDLQTFATNFRVSNKPPAVTNSFDSLLKGATSMAMGVLQDTRLLLLVTNLHGTQLFAINQSDVKKLLDVAQPLSIVGKATSGPFTQVVFDKQNIFCFDSVTKIIFTFVLSPNGSATQTQAVSCGVFGLFAFGGFLHWFHEKIVGLATDAEKPCSGGPRTPSNLLSVSEADSRIYWVESNGKKNFLSTGKITHA